MLLRFTVANHLSIRDRQDLIFAASSLKDNPDGLFRCKAVPIGSVLPAMVIYGSNASGKSNVLDAIATMKDFVLRSHIHAEPEGRNLRNQFKLDPAYQNLPSIFETDFMIDGVRYHYGFEVTDEAIVAEWLYSFPISRSRMIFEREQSEFKFGRELKGKHKNIAEFTARNNLFVSTAAQYGHQQLIPIYEYFKSIEVSRSISIRGADLQDRYFGGTLDARVINFLKSIDSGVVDHRVIKSKISDRAFAVRREVDAIFRKYYPGLRKDPRDEEQIAIEFTHLDCNEEPVFFDIDSVSAGTRRLLIILSYVYQTLDAGTLLCVDEIDASLHTHASEAILKLFCLPKFNPNGAQLVATTHDTHLMNSSVLRRDQLWFTEKLRDGSTKLFSLSDYRTRKGDDIELGYLQGRFGASPSDDIVSRMFMEL